jgi:hypothetical protein
MARYRRLPRSLRSIDVGQRLSVTWRFDDPAVKMSRDRISTHRLLAGRQDRRSGVEVPNHLVPLTQVFLMLMARAT